MNKYYEEQNLNKHYANRDTIARAQNYYIKHPNEFNKHYNKQYTKHYKTVSKGVYRLIWTAMWLTFVTIMCCMFNTEEACYLLILWLLGFIFAK